MTSQSEVSPVDTGFEPGASHAESASFLRGFLGSAVLLLIIRAAEPVFFGEQYYSTLTYHPFWIVVLLAAVQHGLFVGVSTVGVATLMMDWPTRPVGMDITAYYAEMAATPTQWLIVALLIGLYRQTQIRRDQRMKRGNARLAEMNDTLANEIYRLDAALARAELAAATRPRATDFSTRAALDALLHLSDPAANRAEAFIAAARACSDAQIALLEVDDMEDLVLIAATHAGFQLPTSASVQNLSANGARPNAPSPADALASAERRVLSVPIMPAGAIEPVGAVVAIADSPDDLSDLTSSVTLLARAVETAIARSSSRAARPPLLIAGPATEQARLHG